MGHNIELRDYQVECVSQIEQKFKEGKRVVLVVIPGGGGKTIIACHMMERATLKRNQSVFMAHRKELIKQCHKKIGEFGIQAGVIMGSEKQNLLRPVQITSIQTLQRKEELPYGKLIFIDEGHRAFGPGYRKVMKQYLDQGAYIVLLTGTPFRTNKRESLKDICDDYVANIKSSELMSLGFTKPAKVYGSGRISSKGMRSQGGDFRQDELMKAFDTEDVTKNLISNFKKYLSDKKTIVFCCSVQHSIKCTQAFLDAGITAMHIDGNTPSDERDRAVEYFRTGQVQVLLNYGIACEGLDVPDCEGVILNLNTKSRIKYLQACWRGSRPSDATGKTHYIVIDMGDNCDRFGYPDEDIEVDFDAVDESESNGVAPVKICPKCSFMNYASAKCCEDCTEEFKKTKREIEEEEFIEKQRDNKIRKWKKYKQADWRKVKDEDLEEFAKVKGYKSFWVTQERERRKNERKHVKIKDFQGTKQEYYKKVKELENAYYNKKPIDASMFVFLEEDKSYVVFRYVKQEEVTNGI